LIGVKVPGPPTDRVSVTLPPEIAVSYVLIFVFIIILTFALVLIVRPSMLDQA
jgi:hypothetical protein